MEPARRQSAFWMPVTHLGRQVKGATSTEKQQGEGLRSPLCSLPSSKAKHRQRNHRRAALKGKPGNKLWLHPQQQRALPRQRSDAALCADKLRADKLTFSRSDTRGPLGCVAAFGAGFTHRLQLPDGALGAACGTPRDRNHSGAHAGL